ncbi:DoxX family protein [Mycobacterium sp. 3519A]|uniref:DoxX family protein n=1 Tax=Mycobacterium sp. 3519A TaxID=2057184 RepID=UPI000C7E1303|nr:DoxX family protein [Mycobacterium sp. 3519A]
MTTKLDSRLTTYSPAVLSLFRVVFGFLFTVFGTSKLFDWPIAFGIPTGNWPVWYAGIIEFVAGLLIMFGLFTRIAAFIASGHMAVAYFWQHQPHALWPIVGPEMGGNGGLPTILFCFAFFLLVFTGPGAYAVDSMRAGRLKQRM